MRRRIRRGIETLARTGFTAKGIVYLVLGYLGIRAALDAGRAGSTRTALIEILHAPFGRVLLALLAAGLAWYAAWRFIEAFGDANGKGRDLKGLGARAVYAASGVIHSALAIDAASLVLRWDNESGEVRSLLAHLAHGPLAVLAGLTLAACGAYQVWKGAAGKISRQLQERSARREAGPWVIALSRTGIAGRGLLFLVLGYWLTTHPSAGPAMASSSAGPAGALRLLARLPQGDLFMALAALALAAYGAHQLVHARYRRIVVPD
jgi:hypothetical protein